MRSWVSKEARSHHVSQTLRARKGGKKHTYWALVESYRTPRGSRHRVVAYLGELAVVRPAAGANSAAHSPASADPAPAVAVRSAADEPADDEPVLVKLSGIRLERIRDFGDVWLAWGLWRMLGLG